VTRSKVVAVVSVVLIAVIVLVVAASLRDTARKPAGVGSLTAPDDQPPRDQPSASTRTLTHVSMLLDKLTVAPEHRDGYDRDLFPVWIDEDGDGCNTRYEVLLDEAVIEPTVSGSCDLAGGMWRSPYDGQELDGAEAVQIDHLVALAEAWYSGAFAWTTDRRQAFANDLGVPWSLIAVSPEINDAKGASDPAIWLPPLQAAVCPYVESWVGVKFRWGLAVDADEKAALVDLLSRCPDSLVEVPVAP
jgi:hypothetical protein